LNQGLDDNGGDPVGLLRKDFLHFQDHMFGKRGPCFSFFSSVAVG